MHLLIAHAHFIDDRHIFLNGEAANTCRHAVLCKVDLAAACKQICKVKIRGL